MIHTWLHSIHIVVIDVWDCTYYLLTKVLLYIHIYVYNLSYVYCIVLYAVSYIH